MKKSKTAIAPPGSPTALAWRRVQMGLTMLAQEPVLRHPHAAGIRELLGAFRRMCADFEEVAGPEPAFEDLIRRVEAGFGRNRRRLQAVGSDDAQAWVVSEWDAHQDAYEGNKSAFARDYSRRLKNERSLDIGERQIRERWLKGR